MNSRHVYIGNYYSFSTPSSKYRASVVGGFFDVFHKNFHKYRKWNQYRVTASSALRALAVDSQPFFSIFKEQNYFLLPYKKMLHNRFPYISLYQLIIFLLY
jgi:hypothetical protein